VRVPIDQHGRRLWQLLGSGDQFSAVCISTVWLPAWHWAYQRSFDAGGLTWATKENMIPLPLDWQRGLA